MNPFVAFKKREEKTVTIADQARQAEIEELIVYVNNLIDDVLTKRWRLEVVIKLPEALNQVLQEKISKSAEVKANKETGDKLMKTAVNELTYG